MKEVHGRARAWVELETVSLTLPPKRVVKGKKLGLNLSRICENALIESLRCLMPSDNPKKPADMSITIQKRYLSQIEKY
jgi:hypothetical protein